jgi:hypothetical protein
MQDVGIEFRGTARPWWGWLCWCAMIAVCYGGEIGLVQLLHPHGRHDSRALPIVGFGLLAAGAAIALARYLDSRPITVRLTGSGLHLGRFGTAPDVGGPPPGRWWQRGVGTTIGSVLQVRTRHRTVRIGARGRDAAPPDTGGPAATSVHITVSATDFDRLVAALRREVAAPSRRIELYRPGATSVGHMPAMMATLVTGGFLVAGAAELIMLAQHPATAMAVAVVGAIAVLVAVGVQATVLSGKRPKPRYLLEFVAGEAAVYHRSHRCLARGRPRWRRGSRSVRVGAPASMTLRSPAIELTVPPMGPLLIVLPGPLRWSAEPTLAGPYLSVGEPDCVRLLAALGLSEPGA